jgi:hypothetical protein
MEKTVREAGEGAAGIYANLTIPEPLKSPEDKPEVGVEERKNDKGELEINFSMVWVGDSGSPEYRVYAQKLLDALRDRTIEMCSKN